MRLLPKVRQICANHVVNQPGNCCKRETIEKGGYDEDQTGLLGVVIVAMVVTTCSAPAKLDAVMKKDAPTADAMMTKTTPAADAMMSKATPTADAMMGKEAMAAPTSFNA